MKNAPSNSDRSFFDKSDIIRRRIFIVFEEEYAYQILVAFHRVRSWGDVGWRLSASVARVLVIGGKSLCLCYTRDSAVFLARKVSLLAALS